MRALFGLLLFLCGQIDAAPISALAFSPDGTVLAAAARDQLLLRSPTTGAALDAIPCEGMRVSSLAFSPDGSLLAVGGGIPGEKGEVRLLELKRKHWLSSMSSNHDIITSVAFAPGGDHLATSCADNTARIHKIEDHGRRLTEKIVFKGHTGPVQAVAFSPDGSLLVTVSMDRSIKVWSAANGEFLRSFGQHTDAISCLAFRTTADPQAICATAGDDRTVRVWQPAIGRMVRIVRGHAGAILTLAFAPDGGSLFSAGQEGIVRQIDAGSDTIINQWQASSDWIYHLAVSPDGRHLATGDWAGQIAVRKLR